MKRILTVILIFKILFISALPVQAEITSAVSIMQAESCLCNAGAENSVTQCCSTAGVLSFAFEELNHFSHIPASRRCAYFDSANILFTEHVTPPFRPPIIYLFDTKRLNKQIT
ncbi:hypothetical protein [Psychromonas ossibalaenae]|uniref:hypothetical protein n=1 Tax=Psychromonas ossibalaenae TaxID=444922 RepID=UPI000367E449|nr:hypothetical protein [Psychromonas ossibalaenae]